VRAWRAGARRADYFFIYPNAMVNRYGPWLDASTVLPAPGRDGAPACTVQTTWWLDARRAGGADGVAASLAASDQARSRRRAAAGDLRTLNT